MIELKLRSTLDQKGRLSPGIKCHVKKLNLELPFDYAGPSISNKGININIFLAPSTRSTQDQGDLKNTLGLLMKDDDVWLLELLPQGINHVVKLGLYGDAKYDVVLDPEVEDIHAINTKSKQLIFSTTRNSPESSDSAKARFVHAVMSQKYHEKRFVVNWVSVLSDDTVSIAGCGSFCISDGYCSGLCWDCDWAFMCSDIFGKDDQ